MSLRPNQTSWNALSARADTALPALQRLACPEAATQTLREIWRHRSWSSELSAPEVCAVRLLRHHRGSRCTLLLTLDHGPSGGCIAKVYADRDDATAEVMRALHQATFTQRGVYSIPVLLAAIPDMHLLLLAMAPGRSVKDLLSAGDPSAASKAARWLAAFHSAQLPLRASYALHDPLAIARRWTTRLQSTVPAVAASAATALAALVAAAPHWPPRVQLLHGDFGASHVFVAPAVTTVIDWDSCRPGDPAEDGGRFLASLYDLAARRRATRAHAARAAASFRRTYLEALPEAAASLPFYTALACLRKASRIAGNGPAQRERARLLLTAGQDALASRT